MSIVRSTTGEWSPRKDTILFDLAFYETSFVKLQGRYQGMSFTNTASNINQIRKYGWQKRGQTVSVVTSSNTGTTPFKQKSVAVPNMLAIGTTTKLTPPSSLNLATYASSTQALTNQFDSYGVWLKRRHQTHTFCSSIMSKRNNYCTIEG